MKTLALLGAPRHPVLEVVCPVCRVGVGVPCAASDRIDMIAAHDSRVELSTWTAYTVVVQYTDGTETTETVRATSRGDACHRVQVDNTKQLRTLIPREATS